MSEDFNINSIINFKVEHLNINGEGVANINGNKINNNNFLIIVSYQLNIIYKTFQIYL